MAKMNTYYVSAALVLCLASGVLAQSKKEQKGDWLIKKFSYKAAAATFENALEEDSTNVGLKKKLAYCYRMLNDPKKVVMWYEDIIDNDSIVTSEDKYYFALALSSTGNYQEAKKWYSAYLTLVPNDDRANAFYSSLNNLELLYKDSALFDLEKVYFNSATMDFSPAWHSNGLVFVSARSRRATKFNWNETSYLDLYYLSDSMQNSKSDPRPFYQKMNSKFHEGPLVFYDGHQKLVLTRNNFEKGSLQKSEQGVARLKMYFSSVGEDGKWSKAQPFTHNNDEYSVGHPAMNETGNTLYFISDMPGGFGGTDIYVSYLENDQWTEPENLGAEINTEGNEMFPFLHNEETIYFASNGHGGLGGLDIFRFDIEDCQIKNMGYPTNSYSDDFGLILNENGSYGYLSSNRDDSLGYDNLYSIVIAEKTEIKVNLLVLDKVLNTPIPNADVLVKERYSDEEIRLNADAEGKAEILALTNSSYSVTASKANYENDCTELVNLKGGEEVILRLNKKCIITKGSVVVSGSDAPVDSILVILTNKSSSTKDTVLISENDYYEFCVAPNNAYNLKIDKPAFFGKSFDFITKNEEPVELEKVVLEKIVLGKAIKVENIYYDLNKANIREDAAKELDKLVSMLNDNPTITIELSSHTDSRGSDSYNLDLSDRRAKSAVEYIISKGIGSDRITAKGYGETALINRCANGVRCAADEHQANRRTEFKVLKY